MAEDELATDKIYARSLDEIEDFCFGVPQLKGSRNLLEPLSRRGLTDGDGPVASTGDPDPVSQY